MELLAHLHSRYNHPEQLSAGVLSPVLSVLQATLATLDTVETSLLPHLTLSAESLHTLLPTDIALEEPSAEEAQEEQTALDHLLAVFRDIMAQLSLPLAHTAVSDAAALVPFTSAADGSPEAGGIQAVLASMPETRLAQFLSKPASVTDPQNLTAEHWTTAHDEAVRTPAQAAIPLLAQTEATPTVMTQTNAASVASQPASPLAAPQPALDTVTGQSAANVVSHADVSTTVAQPALDSASQAEQTIRLADLVPEAEPQSEYSTRLLDTAASMESHSVRFRRSEAMTSPASSATRTTSHATPHTSDDNAASQALVHAMDPVLSATQTHTLRSDAPESSVPPGSTPVAPESAARLLGHPLPRNTILLQLEPPELGFVQVQVRVHHDSLAATFWADSPEVGALLHSHLPTLNQALQEQGFDASEISINLTTGSFTGHSGQFAQQHTRFVAPLPITAERLATVPPAQPSDDARHPGRYTGQPVRLVDLII
jgi:flagellar hook-length control protein FliK